MYRRRPRTLLLVLVLILAGAAVIASAEGKSEKIQADVVSVEVTGKTGDYRFAVGIASPDTGCEQYADWWEVVSADGDLLHRRVLAHSHIQEQPFVRSGGPVPIAADAVVWVRAHMHPTGYGGTAWQGSVEAGFEAAEMPEDFAVELAQQTPLPTGCAG